jgi:hypothetical protein
MTYEERQAKIEYIISLLERLGLVLEEEALHTLADD